MRVRPALACLAALAFVIVAVGCGSSSRSTFDVAAAASLRKAFNGYAQGYAGATPRFSFAGSDELAAQIEQGVHPDVFASANTKLPAMLYARGLLERPVVFAANKLVLAVPIASHITALAGLATPGVSIAVGSPTVPVGSYTATVLDRLPTALRRSVLANIRDREPNVTGIVGKLAQGAVDAGFLYATDVAASKGRLRAIELPASLRPNVAYAAAVVRNSGQAALARAFIAGLLVGRGRAALMAAGFLPPPSP